MMSHLRWASILTLILCARLPAQATRPPVETVRLDLPDAPSFQNGTQSGIQTDTQHGDPRPNNRPIRPTPCVPSGTARSTNPEAASAAQARQPCAQQVNPYRPFLNSTTPVILTSDQKARLALHDVIDPFNLLTIVANSAFTVGIDSHTAYGPGMQGFGRNVGISLVEDATGEVIGTWGVCSLFHQDPHYYRMPQASPLRRVGHVMAHVVVAQSDSGHGMINFENLITYPASAEISNLYVPGIHGNGPSTVARIVTGLATEPIGNFIAEFLPDVARRIHVRVLIVQQILNQIASGQQL